MNGIGSDTAVEASARAALNHIRRQKDEVELSRCDAFARALLEREGCEEILAQDVVLVLRRLRQLLRELEAVLGKAQIAVRHTEP